MTGIQEETTNKMESIQDQDQESAQPDIRESLLRVQSTTKILTFDFSIQDQLIYLYDHALSSLFYLDTVGNSSFLTKIPDLGSELQNIHVQKDGEHLLIWDRGLGRVHRYNLKTGKLVRLDQSFSFRSFYDHGAWFHEDSGKLTVMGGYGLFQMKNLFLEFDPFLSEWIMPPITGDLPTPGKGRFFYSEEKDSYLYFMIDLTENQSRYVIEVFELPIQTLEWISKGTFHVSTRSYMMMHHLVNQVGNNKIDSEGGIIHIEAGYFYDINKNVIYDTYQTEEIIEVMGVIGYLYTGEPDEWLLVGRKNTVDNTYSAQRVSFTSILEAKSTYLIRPQNPFPVWLTSGLILLVTLTGFGFIHQSKRRKKSTSNSIEVQAHTFKLTFENGEAKLFIEQKWVSVVDPVETKFWQYVFERLSSGNNRSELKHFDEYMFVGDLQASHLSKKRKSFLDSINKKVGLRFVYLVNSSIDKRYKEIVFEDSLINL